jgi:hypothetical protein
MKADPKADLKTQVFDRNHDHDYCNRAAIRLRRQVYGAALQWARMLRTDLTPNICLTGLTPTAYAAYREQWQPYLAEREEQSHTTAYQIALGDDFVTYRHVAKSYAALYEMPIDWMPHRFELAIWHEKRMCAVAKTSMNEIFFKTSIMPVGIVMRDPGLDNPLRGAIGPLVHCAALAWALAIGRKEVHYLGGFSAQGEKMVQNLSTQYGFTAEPRGCSFSRDTMRFQVASNLQRLGVNI